MKGTSFLTNMLNIKISSIILFIVFTLTSLSTTTLYASNQQEIIQDTIQPIMTSPAWVYETDGSFEDIKEELLLAIEAKGLVISFTSHSAKMFARTAKSVGQNTLIYKNGETVFFCKADLSHKMVEENPHNVIFCPYSIAVYELVKQPGKVFLTFAPPQQDIKSYQAIHHLLIEIITETLDF